MKIQESKLLKLFFLVLCLHFSFIVKSQTWSDLESEYKSLLKDKKNDLALKKAKQLSIWVEKTQIDTSIYFPISLKYIGSSFQNIDSAIFYYDSALNVLNKQNRNNSLEAAKIHFNKSNIYFKKNNKQLGILEAERSILLLNFNNYSEYPFCIWPLKIAGKYYLEESNSKKAFDFYTKAADLIQKYEGIKCIDYTKIQFAIGDIYWTSANYDSAKVLYSFALNNQNELEGSLGIGYLNNLKIIENKFRSRYMYDYALKLYLNTERTQKATIKSRNDSLIYSNTLGVIASLYKEMEQYDSASNYYNKSIDIISNPQDSISSYLLAINSINIGLIFYETTEYQKAEEKFKNALRIFKKLSGENHPNYLACINNLGGLYGAIDNWGKALDYFKIAIKIDGQLSGENSSSYADHLNNIGIAYYNIGDFQSALQLCRQALDLRGKTIGEISENYANSLSTIGTFYYNSLNYDSAELYYKNSLNIFEITNGINSSKYAHVLKSFGELYLKKGDFEKAKYYLTESLRINRETFGNDFADYFKSLSLIGDANILLGNVDSAIEIYLELSNNILKTIAKNFRWMSEKEKHSYWDNKKYFIERLNSIAADYYFKNNKLLTACFDINLAIKSALLESSRNFDLNYSKSGDTILIALYHEFRRVKRLSTKLISEGSASKNLIFGLEKELDSLGQILSRKASLEVEYKNNFSLTWQNVQSNLNNQEAAIEFVRYFDSNDSSYNYLALIVKAGMSSPFLVKICNEIELKNLSTEVDLDQIYSLVWKPIANQIEGIKSIYYAPTGIMNNIPFHALYKETSIGREYLIDRYSLHYLISTRTLALDLKKKAQVELKGDILLFGGINFNELPQSNLIYSSLSPSESGFLFGKVLANRSLEERTFRASFLPGTKREVHNIEKILKSNYWEINLFENRNSTENNLKYFSGKIAKSVVHIATHGFSFPNYLKTKQTKIEHLNGMTKFKTSDNPMIRCGLLLSGANITLSESDDQLQRNMNEDGVLTAFELSELDLTGTKLAVLSACETGLGEIQDFEGVFGLNRALKLAGVDNIIVSLWEVPDDATMDMMTNFYTELAKSKLPVFAFEIAQKEMRKKYPNEPNKWAGFVFMR